MDGFDIVQFVQKAITERRSSILAVLENNGISEMGQYRELMGELNALNYITQELTGLLDEQEQMDD
jgi:hypothetical protein